jgi:hypothetical protein
MKQKLKQLIDRLEEIDVAKHITDVHESGEMHVEMVFPDELLESIYSGQSAGLICKIRLSPDPDGFSVTHIVLPFLYTITDELARKQVFEMIFEREWFSSGSFGSRWSFDPEDGELRVQFDHISDEVPSSESLAKYFSFIENVIPLVVLQIHCINCSHEIPEKLESLIQQKKFEAAGTTV